MKLILGKVQIRVVLGIFATSAAFLGMLIANIVRIESLWIIFPFMAMRISTMITALLSFVLVLFLQQKTTYKALYYALLAVIFSMGLYEIVWYYIAAAFRGYDLRIFQFAALLGWVMLGAREVVTKRPSRLSVLLYGVFVISMLLWAGTGFEFNDLGNSSFSISGEILNVTSKAALAIAYALHIGIESEHIKQKQNVVVDRGDLNPTRVEMSPAYPLFSNMVRGICYGKAAKLANQRIFC